MNRLVCPRDKIDLGNLFFEGEERSSRTQGGVRGAPHQRNLVRPSTRLCPVCYYSINTSNCPFVKTIVSGLIGFDFGLFGSM